MNRIRHLKLSSFRMNTKDEKEDKQSELSRCRTNPEIYRRCARELGRRPKLIRHTSDLRQGDWKLCGWEQENVSLAQELRLLDWKRFRWNKTDPDLYQKSKLRLIETPKKKDEKKSQQPRSSRKVKRVPKDLFTLDEEILPMTTRSLPPLPTNGLGEPMLRRPTIFTPRPIPEDGDLFSMITKGRELRPFSFEDDPVKTDEFYEEHFPLLCEKNTTVSHTEPGSAKGHGAAMTLHAVDPTRPSSSVKRAKEVRWRVSASDRRLAELENDSDASDNDVMVTELRHRSFDPTNWSWNKQKYTISESSTVEQSA